LGILIISIANPATTGACFFRAVQLPWQAIWGKTTPCLSRSEQCIHKLSARGSADFRPLQREQANEFGLFNQSRGTGDIEAP